MTDLSIGAAVFTAWRRLETCSKKGNSKRKFTCCEWILGAKTTTNVTKIGLIVNVCVCVSWFVNVFFWFLATFSLYVQVEKPKVWTAGFLCEMIEALLRLLLSCFAVLFLRGVVLLFLSLTVYALSALINPNISSVCFFLLINYLFSMILSVCLCSLHCILHLCVCFSFRSRFALPVYSDNSHTLFLAFVTFSSGKKSPFPSLLLCGMFSLFFPFK